MNEGIMSGDVSARAASPAGPGPCATAPQQRYHLPTGQQLVPDQLLRWLLRFPLLRIEDLTILSGLSRSRVSARIADLTRQELVIGRSLPLRDERRARLYALTKRGLQALAEAYGSAVWRAARRWSADESGVLRLLPRAPALVAVQAFVLALLADAPRALSPVMSQRGASRMPSRAMRVEWSWVREYPLHFAQGTRSGVLRLDAYVRLTIEPVETRAGSPIESVRHVQPADATTGRRRYGIFVLYDGGLGDERRTLQQLRLFLRCRETCEEQTLGSVFPALLILAPDARRAVSWQTAALRLATERWLTHPLVGGVLALDAQLTPLEEAGRARRPLFSPWRPSWRSLSASTTCRLDTVLTSVMDACRLPRADAIQAPQSAVIVTRNPRSSVERDGVRPRLDPHSNGALDAIHMARVAQAIEARHLSALRLLYAHPLLHTTELAAALGVADRSVARYLRRLLTLRLIRPHEGRWPVPPLSTVPSQANGRSTDASTRRATARYLLTPLGLRLLAAGDNLPGWRVSSRWEQVSPPSLGQRTPLLLTRYERETTALARTPEHTAGVYTFFALLLRSAQAQCERDRSGCLLWWETGSACARQYRDLGGWHAVRPDGAGAYQAERRPVGFWLEWDRGTMGRRDLEAKFTAYAHYLRSREWRADGNAPLPLLLMVTSDRTQETRIIQAAQAMGDLNGAVRLYVTTSDQLFRHGPLLSIWRPWTPGRTSGHSPLGVQQAIFV